MAESSKASRGRRESAAAGRHSASLALRVALGAFVVVFYNSWVLWPLNGDPQVLSGYLSELAAQDQPYQWVFRLTDVASACAFGAIAALGRRGWASWLGRWSAYLALALLLAAVGTVLDAIFNLPCAESRDAACASTFGVVRRLHEAASVLASVALIAIIGLVALAFAELDGCWSRRAVAVAAFAVLVAILLVSSAVLPFVVPGVQGPLQLVQVPLSSAWIAFLAWRLDAGPSRSKTPSDAGSESA
ncbi:MAG: DUF998 domain-containing protein [Actinomycetaceae bacterium]|nr:DUF998 domain-containing protein [Actinomycetaceae bacterium]